MIFVFSFLVGVFCFAAKAFFVSKKKTVIEKQEPNETAVISQIEQKKDAYLKLSKETQQYISSRKFFDQKDVALSSPAIIKNACLGVEPMRDSEYITRVRRWPLANALPTIDDWTPPKKESNLKDLRSLISDLKTTTDDWYKITDGTHRVRFLPQGEFNPYVFITRRQHYVNGSGVGGEPISCRKKLVNGSWRGDCPLCDYYENLKSNQNRTSVWGNDAHSDDIRTIRPVQRYYYNVLAILPDGTKTLKLLSLSAFIHNEIFNESGSKNNYAHLTDLRNGRDVTIKRQTITPGGFPQFLMNLDSKETLAIEEDSINRVMANCRDLTKIADQWDASDEKMQAAIDSFVKRQAKPKRFCRFCTDSLSEQNKQEFCSNNCEKKYLSYTKNNLR